MGEWLHRWGPQSRAWWANCSAAGGMGWCLLTALGTGIVSNLNVGPLGRLIIGLKCPLLLLLLLLLVGGAGHDAEGSELEDEGG